MATLGGTSAIVYSGGLGYCEVGDVEVLLETQFGTTTKPTTAQVEELIVQCSDAFCAETHHAWHEVTVAEEIHDMGTWIDNWIGIGWEIQMKLFHRKVRAFSIVDGDKIEYWTGSEWTDILATGTEGRGADFWCDYTNGILYVRSRIPSTRVSSFKVTYRYGETVVPGDVRLAAAKMVSREVIRSMNRVEIVTEGTGRFAWESKASAWDEEINRTLDRRREMSRGTL